MIVVSDLDGTLLDHHNYSWDAALPALSLLQARQIPLILNTSKTRAELAEILRALNLHTPYIVENGSAIYSADNEHCQRLGASLDDIRGVLTAARKEGFAFLAYADLDPAQLSAMTGLSLEEARSSLAREFSEPLVWQDDESRMHAFKDYIWARGLQCLSGGRFFHVMGRCDKGAAMRALLAHYYPEETGPVVALGDGENDIAMLEQADIAVCIRSPVNAELRLSDAGTRRIIRTQAPGPVGWCEAIQSIIEQREG